MSNTKTMLVTITVFIITLLCLNTIVWWLESNITYKEAFSHGAFLFLTLFVGWIPAVIVGKDYHEYIN